MYIYINIILYYMFQEIAKKYSSASSKKNKENDEPPYYEKVKIKETDSERKSRLESAFIVKNNIITPSGAKYDLYTKEKL
jgi:hypothetical protein